MDRGERGVLSPANGPRERPAVHRSGEAGRQYPDRVLAHHSVSRTGISLRLSQSNKDKIEFFFYFRIRFSSVGPRILINSRMVCLFYVYAM